MILRIFLKVLKIIRKLISWIILLISLLGIAAIAYFAYKYVPVLEQYISDADKLVKESSADTFHTDNTSYIYSNDGTEIAELRAGADSTYLNFKDIPDDVLHAFIAIEDKRYYKHHGVDWASTAKSLYLLIRDREISRGGSTITQQLVRNVYTEEIGFKKSYERKLREIFTALCLEKRFDKDDILEFYVNNINYGNNYYGIEAASVGYFGKSVSELSVAEVALLCAIPNNPTYYDPRAHLEHTVARRNIIIREMYNQNYIGEDEYLESINSSVAILDAENVFFNYESSFAIRCAVEYLMEYTGFEFRYAFDTQDTYNLYREEYSSAYADAEKLLYTGGYKIYTTLDLATQQMVQSCLDTQLKAFNKKTSDGIFVVQGAATVIDNDTGKVVACVGGRSQDELLGMQSLNRAFQSYMQPGSTIKPLIVYTPALQAGYTAKSIVSDSPIEGGPANAGDSYLGDITLRTAVEKSKNVVAWRLFEEIGPKVGLSYVQNMHFDKITPNDYFQPASLGGLYYGVTTTQMAAAYATLANSGVYRPATCLTAILNADGDHIYLDGSSTRVYSADSANAMLDILAGVANTGTAAGLKLEGNSKMPIACKTGTTNDNRCAWFCGVTPYYSVAVYVGRDDNKSTKNLTGASYPKDIWAEIQSSLCSGKPIKKLYEKVKSQKKKSKKTTEVTDDNTKEENGESRDVEADGDREAPTKTDVTFPIENSSQDYEVNTETQTGEFVPVETDPTQSVEEDTEPPDSAQSTEEPSAPERSTEELPDSEVSTKEPPDSEQPTGELPPDSEQSTENPPDSEPSSKGLPDSEKSTEKAISSST